MLLHNAENGLDVPLPISVDPAYTSMRASPAGAEPDACTARFAGAANVLPLDGHVIAAPGCCVSGVFVEAFTVMLSGAETPALPWSNCAVAVNEYVPAGPPAHVNV